MRQLDVWFENETELIVKTIRGDSYIGTIDRLDEKGITLLDDDTQQLRYFLLANIVEVATME